MRTLVAVALSVLVLPACEDSKSVLAPEPIASMAVVDGAHHNGNPHFFFLAPMVPNPNATGVFDGSLAPTVEICVMVADGCSGVLAIYTTTSGPGAETVRVDASNELYIVNWHTDQFTLDQSQHYRIRVLVSGAEVGRADVDVVSAGRELKNVETGDYIPLLDGRTLPIKFRIEEGLIVATKFMVSDGAGRLLTFPLDANGDVAPTATLGGAAAGTGFLTGMARDESGNLYVADISSSKIHVFAPGAVGNVAPIRTIGGPSTRLSVPIALLIDASGMLYVANQIGGTVTVYAPDASGDAAPIRTLAGPQTRIVEPWGLAIDAAGSLYVGDIGTNVINVFAPAANGDATPLRTIAGPSTQLFTPAGLAFDSDGNLYVANIRRNTVTVYAPHASGDATPIRILGGPNTGLVTPSGIALTPSGHLYVANQFDAPKVTVYAPGAGGDATPVATIAGPTTGITKPVFVLF